jgi:hypothetical protein
MTILTKSLLALALTSFVAQAHILTLNLSSADEPRVDHLEAGVVWNTVSSYEESGHPVDAVFRRALPWQPETLQFHDVYTLSLAPDSAPAESVGPTPVYDAFVIGSNLFATSTYWIAGLCVAMLAIVPKLKRARRGQPKLACVVCDSREIRRVPVGNGMLADLRRAFGQRAFRCNACTAKFFRRWNYEGSPNATRAQVS